MSYITTAELKTMLGIASADSQDDGVLQEFLNAADALIDRECRRTFAAGADTTRYMDALADVDGLTLRLPGDLCQITTVTNGNGATVASSAYVTEPRNGEPWYALILKRSGSVRWTYSGDPENAIAITGRWAYSLQAPDDIRQAVRRLAMYYYRQKDNADPLLDRPLQSADGVLIMPTALPADIWRTLKHLRRTI